MLAARMVGLPVVFSYRNRMWFRDWKRVVEFVAAVMACTGVASNNPPAQSTAPYRWLYRRRNGVVIPNALDLPEDLRGCCVLRAHAPFRLLFAGRLTRQKNWRCLIEALSGLTAEREWELGICGEGEDRALLTAAVNAAGIAARVRLKGYCRDLVAEMRDCDLLVAPSWYEGAPNVLLEALYLGLPALVSDIAAHREVLGAVHASCCFRPDDPAGLRTALAAILDDPARLVAIRSAQGSIAFTRPVAAARAYQAYYEKVVAKAALAVTRK
jgi:glycosyltransferase involved in cell wall biosynthesis